MPIMRIFKHIHVGFYPKPFSLKLVLLFQHDKIISAQDKALFNGFNLNGHTLGFYPQT